MTFSQLLAFQRRQLVVRIMLSHHFVEVAKRAAGKDRVNDYSSYVALAALGYDWDGAGGLEIGDGALLFLFAALAVLEIP